MNYKSLDSFFKIVSGGTPDRKNPEYFDGNIPWIKTGDLKNKYIVNSPEKITESGLNNSSAKVFPVNTVLVAMYGATIGACSILNIEAATNQACAAFLPSNQINHEFLYYYIKGIRKQLIQRGQGGGQQNISIKILKEFKIPVINISDQLEIVQVLNKAERLINTRKENIELLDTFLKNTFLEIFGNPILNDFGFTKGSIRDVVKEVKYGTSKSADSQGRYRYLRMNNIDSNGYMDYSDLKHIDLDKKEIEKYSVTKGDLLFNRTNSKELVGKTGVYSKNEKMIIAGYLLRVRTNEKANAWYLWGYLNSVYGKKALSKMSKSIVGMANINALEFQNIKILIPPVTLQNRFADIVQKTNAIRDNLVFNLNDLQYLYNSLSDQAFKGYLKINKEVSKYQKFDIPDATSIINLKTEQKIRGKVQTTVKEITGSLWETTKSFGKGENIPFSTVEGDAVIRLVFSKKTHGFTFHEFDEFLKKEGFVYNYEKIKDFIFSKLESKELVQYYANKEWMITNYNPQISPLQDDFAGIDGNIWYVPQQSRS